LFFVDVELSQTSDSCLNIGKKARSREERDNAAEAIDLVLVTHGLDSKSDSSAPRLAVNGELLSRTV